MFGSLRTRLLIGLTPLLAIMVGLGLWAIVMFSRLGNNIDVILKENYRSVLAAEGMKEALERMDSALLFAIGGKEEVGKAQFEEYQAGVDRNLKIEQGNVTLEGEQEMADELKKYDAQYGALARRFFALGPESKEERTHLYFGRLLPTFNHIKLWADKVLDINQKNMEAESARARNAAAL